MIKLESCQRYFPKLLLAAVFQAFAHSQQKAYKAIKTISCQKSVPKHCCSLNMLLIQLLLARTHIRRPSLKYSRELGTPEISTQCLSTDTNLYSKNLRAIQATMDFVCQVQLYTREIQFQQDVKLRFANVIQCKARRYYVKRTLQEQMTWPEEPERLLAAQQQQPEFYSCSQFPLSVPRTAKAAELSGRR